MCFSLRITLSRLPLKSKITVLLSPSLRLSLTTTKQVFFWSLNITELQLKNFLKSLIIITKSSPSHSLSRMSHLHFLYYSILFSKFLVLLSQQYYKKDCHCSMSISDLRQNIIECRKISTVIFNKATTSGPWGVSSIERVCYIT